MEMTADENEVAMNVSNGLSPRYGNLIVTLSASVNEDKRFTLGSVKSKFPKEEQGF